MRMPTSVLVELARLGFEVLFDTIKAGLNSGDDVREVVARTVAARKASATPQLKILTPEVNGLCPSKNDVDKRLRHQRRQVYA